MRRKRLGRTELELPIVGIGTAFVGIPSQQDTVAEYEGAPSQVDRELGARALVAAIDAGCTYFDTAPLYGRGLSEAMLGEALRQRPEKKDCIIISTKAGRWHDGYDFSFDGITRSVENSLTLLGLESIDILHIHDAMGQPMDAILSADGALGALRQLQRQGLIGHIGSASNNPPTNLAYIRTGEFDCAVIADSWSLINQLAAREIFAEAAWHDTGLVAATPIERGLLAVGPSVAANYLNRVFSQDCLDQVRLIQSLCADYAVPMLAVALHWCSRHPQVASTIPGARVPHEAVECIEAAQLEIPEQLWEDLEPLIRHFDSAIDV